MKSLAVRQIQCIRGTFSLPGDKSIAHRGIIIGAICPGETLIKNFPFNKDSLSTIKIFRQLGVAIKKQNGNFGSGEVRIFGRGRSGLRKPRGPLMIQESGTTFRLTAGVLAGQSFRVTLSAGAPLKRRPMRRITGPLRMMGARIISVEAKNRGMREEYPPLTIRGGNLSPLVYRMPVASAQVKSALLLAGLYSSGETKIIEPIPTRDHTERMLRLFKADITLSSRTAAGTVITVTGKKELRSPGVIEIPGDMSSAAFFAVLAAIVPQSVIKITNVSLNPTRSGIISVLKRMKVRIQIHASKFQGTSWEPSGDILIRSSFLKGTVVRKEEIPSIIDEVPVLMVAACFAQGKTVFEGVGELRVKETDRIISMTENLKMMGAHVEIRKKTGSEDILIKGTKMLVGSRVRSFGDHRTAMSLVVAGLAAGGQTRIDDVSCIDKSFPGFLGIIKRLTDSGGMP